MEASVLSATLNVVANKLAPLVIKQYSSIVGVTEDLKELKDLVEEINCLLERIGYEAKGNDPSLNWLKKLKDVAYTADDIVDEFQLKAEEHDAALATNGGIISNMWIKPKSFIFQCKAASKVKAIKKEFATIVKQRTDFSAIANSLLDSHPIRHINNTIVEMPSLPIVDEALVLGRDGEKQKIISKLVETNDQNGIKVVSIIGLGGSGKTTLAKLIFNDDKIIAKHFEVRLWVHVSQEFDVEKLVQKLFESFSDNDSGQYKLPYMSKTISDKLTGKRFLLVLDDVWTESQTLWEEFIIYLKSGTPGSRVLLTTRSSSSAETVPLPSTYLFNLPLLSQDDSWQLFKQSLRMPAEVWRFEFGDVGKEIVSKCGGLPLAIKVLAGVLHDKKLLKEWYAIRDSNLLDVDGKEHRVFACLRLSYSRLSPHLRQCFTMCSLFPKGYRIDKEQLIDQWIAHDMIPLTDGDDLEHIGDQYFNSLVQISFLQDVDQNSDGRVKCTMHDLVHDLSRSILGDEISFVLPEDTTNSTKRYRYFSLTERSRNPWSKHLCAKARAIYVSCGQDVIFDDAFRNTKHLRSVTVECICAGARAVPTTILQIKNLRYLHLSTLGCQTLPEAISDVWSLQSLHVTYSHLIELPRSIGKLQKLRAVNLSHCFRLESLPDSLGDCPMISSIDLYNCKNFTTLPNSICKNKHLRVLRLGLTRIERMPSGITALENLECLDLRMCCELEELPEGIGNLKNLVVMNLEGCRGLESMPVGIGQLSQLRKLGLFAVKEGESFAKISELGNIGKIDGELTIRGIARGMDPYEAQKACLKRNTNLRSLTLMWETNGRVNTKNELLVLHYLEPPNAIKCLKVHGYAGLLYPWWLLKQGGHLRFPRLSILELSDFPKLKHLHELVELPCLEKLILTGMPRLESISGGPFPSLAKLYMWKLPRLGELWLVTERSLVVGEEGSGCMNSIPLMGLLQIGNYLSHLVISECPELKIKPYMPTSLQDLTLDGANEQLLQSPGQRQESSWSSSDADLRPSLLNFGHLMELRLWSMTVASSSSSTSVSGFGCEREPLQHLMELETLQISNFHCLTELPESMWSLTSLQSLTIAYCSALVQLPERLGELCSLKGLWIEGLPGLRSFPQSLQHLTSLVSLNIGGCDALYHLPECVGELHSLTHFTIWNLPGLTCLPQSMRRLTSLEELSIGECPGLTFLPEWISELTALELLDISGCPVLMRRYEKGKGEDCHLTAHIPFVW